MRAGIGRGRSVRSRDALGIVALAMLIVLVRMLFSPAPVVLPPPDAFFPEQGRADASGDRLHAVPEQSYAPVARPAVARSSHTAAMRNEPFDFDPNAIDSVGFRRLGFSSAQTQALLRYRASGAVFRRPEDFARSYVVSEQMYRRLKPYIQIRAASPPSTGTRRTDQMPEPPPVPRNDSVRRIGFPRQVRVELNAADTARLRKLRGIGPYYAQKIAQYRERLGGFVAAEQLMEIEGIDEERFALMMPQIEIDCGLIRKISLRTADRQTLAKHPYIGPYAARWVVHYRTQSGDSVCTIPSLLRRNIIKPQQARLLEYYME